ncbi:hypothetical protein HPB49_001520 [Dermacentor silvarum]|uniref:Uncharacterized protein n=1 Tax=Dermacentor silvarum TaxID=543639 RepID=A0ACB8DLZ8_DERSI|nr:hypothetical protein HPB49_001520 [Dermacentor silvarum]
MNIRRPVPPLSLSNEARRTSSDGPDYGLLPRRAWLIILDYLDAESRLAVADLGPNFERLVRGERCMRTVICGANHESASVRSLLEGGRSKHVRSLHLTNCIVATPDSLLACVALCTRLTDLRCVGCPLDADLLLKVVTKWLPSLQRLEWSLRIRNFVARASYRADYRRLRDCASTVRERARTRLRRSRARSAGEPQVLGCLRKPLPQPEAPSRARAPRKTSPRLPAHPPSRHQRRSFHLLEGRSPLWRRLLGRARIVHCQQTLLAVCRPRKRDVQSAARFPCSLPTRSSWAIWCRDAAFSSWSVLGNLVLVVLVTAEAPGMLLQAAAEQSWNGLRALTLVSASEPDDISAELSGGHLHGWPCGKRRVSPCLAHALGIFLAACRTLTELNLSAFHFSQEHMIFTDITAASGLGRLRALSVAPCALMTPGEPLRILAVLCTRLEELDLNDVSEPAFNNWRSSLRRLTLYNVQQIGSLHFLAREFHVGELRLCGLDALPTRSGSHELLGGILAHNPYLRSLVIEHDALPLHADFLWSTLGAARQLRYLCLLSKVSSRRAVIMRFAGDLLRLLPSLVSLHVHYAEADSPFAVAGRRTTLVRRARSWFENDVEDGQVVVLEEDQCVLCCTSTFVGLAKPRNRNWCRL